MLNFKSIWKANTVKFQTFCTSNVSSLPLTEITDSCINLVLCFCALRDLEVVSAHLNKTDKYVKLTREDVKKNSLAFLDCAVKMEKKQKPYH